MANDCVASISLLGVFLLTAPSGLEAFFLDCNVGAKGGAGDLMAVGAVAQGLDRHHSQLHPMTGRAPRLPSTGARPRMRF